MLVRDTIEVVVQVNGKLRDRLHVPAGTSENELVALALASERSVRTWTASRGDDRRARPARQRRRITTVAAAPAVR